MSDLTERLIEGPAKTEHELNGRPPAALEAYWATVVEDKRDAVLKALMSEPSDWLAAVLTEGGFPVSSSTIRTYRRSLRQAGVQV